MGGYIYSHIFANNPGRKLIDVMARNRPANARVQPVSQLNSCKAGA